jgi:adenylate cyclase
MIACVSCGTEIHDAAKFCSECGAVVTTVAKPAEFKQVTVLFADVVHSMDIAAAVGAERLREIMTELVNAATAVVKRFGGTVDKFTGDGIMAVFGAPVALEDHAFRACLAALDIQRETQRLAAEIERCDGVALQLRVGLNSGQVIAGEIGSSALGYTAVGEQVGMAQRMESAAPPGGVMLSESTARLVEDATILGEPELVHIKGADTPVPAKRLLGIGDYQPRRRGESPLVGRQWEIGTVTAILEESIGGAGCVVNIMGPPGIGKSRLVREAAALAVGRGVPVPVFTTYCESHASGIPFHVVARLLRAGLGVSDLDDRAARASVRTQVPDADPEDLLLLDDLLGIHDAAVALPDIAPDARRRRLTALVNAASLARETPAVYVIEDAHWIDEVSESMLADFLAVIPHTPALVLITYRPEYHGALSRVSGAQAIALRPLTDTQTSALTTELLGSDASMTGLAALIGARAAGNPFFVEEIVRDLAERGMLRGDLGAYMLRGDVDDIDVPATVQAAIGARIDRLEHAAKHTLNAAAVIGTRFDTELLASLIDSPDVAPLIEAELVDQMAFFPRAEYAFRHPLIRAVAYESQLKSDRAQLHRRLASIIEASGSGGENAALIAEHVEAAGDLRAAYGWHMRAGTWSTNRDIAAAQTSWRRARHVADALPDDDPERAVMRIAPRTLLSGSAWRVGGSGADTGFDELRELCTAAGDERSLAIGMAGLVMAQLISVRRREASGRATEHTALLESIGDPTLVVGLSFAAMVAKQETGEMVEVLALAQRVIELADGDPTAGNMIFGSPLAVAITMRGAARWCLGIPGWRDDFAQAVAMARAADPVTLAGAIFYTYVLAIPGGALLPDATAMRETAEALELTERSGDDIALLLARFARGITLAHRDGPEREAGFALLAQVREAAVQERFSLQIVPIVDIQLAQQMAGSGDLDGAIELSRAVLEDLFGSGGAIWSVLATTVLVESMLRRRADGDLAEAQGAIDRLAAVPVDARFVLHEIFLLRLRALLARARGDEVGYPDYRDRYRQLATELGLEGHIVLAKAMI